MLPLPHNKRHGKTFEIGIHFIWIPVRNMQCMRLVTVYIVALSFPRVNSIKRVIITGLITANISV